MSDIDALEAQMAQLRDDILRLLDEHQKKPTERSDALLRQLRNELALTWVKLQPDDLERALNGGFGELHERVMYSGLRELPPTAEESPLAQALEQALGRGWSHPETPAAFLAMTLFAPAHRSGLQLDIDEIAPWLRASVLRFMFEVPRLFVEPGEARRYLDYVRRLLDWIVSEVFAWKDAGARKAVLAQFASSGFMVQTYFTDDDLRDLMEKRALILERFAEQELGLTRASLDGNGGTSPAARAEAGARVKLGILVPHLNPQTETFYLLSHYEHLPRDRFHVIIYTLAERQHPLHDICASHADEVVQLSARDPGACAARIRRDDLDVLLFGTNLTAAASPSTVLALHRLARKQIAVVNCPITTGMRHMDYFLSPALHEPAGAAAHYTEKLLLLPGWANVFAYQQDLTAPTRTFSRAELGIAGDAVVFASGANYFKILPELDRTFAHILAAVPGSVLLLYPFNPNWTSSYEGAPLMQRLRRNLAGQGVAPERLVVQGPVPTRADIHELLKLADVYLDSFPYSGSCSLMDPLSVGCPPIVLEGSMMRSRQGSAIMRALGLDGLITTSEDEYIRLAVGLAEDGARRRALRDEVARRMVSAPILDTRGFSRAVGEALLVAAGRAEGAADDVAA
jgi:predicted O-linked N-acetylglucosamine transferase (SPINDLY family)